MNYLDNIYIKYILMKRNLKKDFREFLKDENGAGVIELVLILVVLIGLVIVFKDKIGALLNNIFTTINDQAKTIYQ